MSTDEISNEAIRRSLKWFGAISLAGAMVRGLFFQNMLWIDLGGIAALYLSEEYARDDRASVRWSLILTAWYALISAVGLATNLSSHLRMGVFGQAALFDIGFQLVRGVWAAALFLIIRRDAAGLKRGQDEVIAERPPAGPASPE